MKQLVLLIALLTFGSLQAQQLQTPTLSPFSEISQEVGLTEMSLSYSRPSAKGRTVFGELVPYGEIWRTGANASTKLTVSEEVMVAGHKPCRQEPMPCIPFPAPVNGRSSCIRIPK